MGLGRAIEHSSSRFARLLRHERHLQPVLAKALAFPSHRGSGNVQSLRDPLVRSAIEIVGIGLEQNASVEQFAGVLPAAADERFESPALLFSEADDVLLVQ